MDHEEFRRHAHRMVDWMADYLGNVESHPVRPARQPGDLVAALPTAAPEEPEPMDTIFQDFMDLVVPGMTHWQHPRFMAYFPANASPPSVLAEMLTATMGAQCMLWQTSPAASEMEAVMMTWLRQAIGLPEAFTGVIQDSASSATLCALLAARERALDWSGNQAGLAGGAPLAVYASAEAHSSVVKAAKIAGYGMNHVRLIETDEDFALRPDRLRDAMAKDRDAGIIPACIVACLGTTGVGAMDDLRAIGPVAAEFGAYLHVDAAWAGSALILDEYRGMIDGVDAADSFVFNPHKWLMTNFDCSAHFVKDPDTLLRTLAINPDYLKTAGETQPYDFRDWGIPLGRRFRALKLWFVLRGHGLEGLRRIVARHIDLAAEAEQWVHEAPGFEIVAPRSLSLFNFRLHPPGLDDPARLDALNHELVETVNTRGVTYLTPNTVRGAAAIRFNVGQATTESRHVYEAWKEIQMVGDRLAPRKDE